MTFYEGINGCSRECWIVSAGYRRRQAEGEYNHDLAKRGRVLQGVALSSMRFHPTGRGHEDDEDGQEGWSTTANAIPYWIDRRLTGLAGPDYDATILSGLPIEPEDSQYGESWFKFIGLQRPEDRFA